MLGQEMNIMNMMNADDGDAGSDSDNNGCHVSSGDTNHVTNSLVSNEVRHPSGEQVWVIQYRHGPFYLFYRFILYESAFIT